MLIIFGTRAYVATIAMLTFLCPGCQNPAAHALRKRVTKFTLFFIPLFPISTSHHLQCTFCGRAGSLSKEQAEGLLAAAATPAAAEPVAATEHQAEPRA
jgi:zinc-ribbon family